MATTIEQLLKTPPKKLLEELDRVRDRERLIAHERELLERVLEILAESSDGPEGWLNDLEQGPVTIGPLRSQILRVMTRGGQDRWLPREIHRELVEHGNKKATLDNVRTTLRRMLADGEVRKPEAKKLWYTLP